MSLTDKKDNFDGVEMKFEAEDETFIDNGFEESCNNYSDHDSEDEPKILLKCDICSKEYQTKERLFRHRKYLHKLSEQQQFKCSKFNYKTLIKQKCLRHVKIHDKKKPLKMPFLQTFQ
ncbi:unnamed protein product [Brassicogethes aeneus]|uniref:C2H2-type domain-containing protein n=1 Tax=Brassicogethes aeneus TaxID=1431903 RepID=A0A9P0AVA5_BRAAE|nr:unnamed protein product [Brassicogethes aeneus]